jgi:membrane associated rhomboid family serine protease
MTRAFGHGPINFRMMSSAIKLIIVANAVVFALSQIAGDPFFGLFGLIPRKVLEERWVWQPITYLFVHGNFVHLLFNLFALWMFGMPIEAAWGEREFFKYYFLCGLGAAAASIALAPHSGVPVIGASGSVYGLLVAFAMLYPEAVVYLYFMIPVKAWQMALLFGLIEFFAGTAQTTPGIARFAHLGGMVTGYLYLRWWWVLKAKTKQLFEGVGLKSEVSLGRRVPRPRPKGKPEDSAMAEIDRILDKILVSGLDSLTDEEREIMKRYSKS